MRLARVVDRWKRVVLDVDELDGVLRHRRALGDDRRDVLAHVPHFAVGECGLGELLRDERDLVDGLGREVARREDRDDARLDRRGSGVEVHDACTRHWRCHEREHERPVGVQIGREVRRAVEQLVGHGPIRHLGRRYRARHACRHDRVSSVRL